jgi:NADH dehydrogenase FAD-containing subunit
LEMSGLVGSRCAFTFSSRCHRANLRGSVKPEMAAAVLIPYSKTLKFGRVVRGEVTRIEKSSVVLADGQQLPYNYLVIGA